MGRKTGIWLSAIVVAVLLIGFLYRDSLFPLFGFRSETDITSIEVIPFMIGEDARPVPDTARQLELTDKKSLVKIDKMIKEGKREELPEFQLREDNYPDYTFIIYGAGQERHSFYWEQGILVVPHLKANGTEKEQEQREVKMVMINLADKDAEKLSEMIKSLFAQEVEGKNQ
ncbi:hypothetical protein [Niallia taxi]|uniref:hypothetical protein n=1 Tax=Niallia taxi TaxID=2499688 RepID=UPI0015F680EC|nr:hypothetical protein [Niallia taxi]